MTMGGTVSRCASRAWRSWTSCASIFLAIFPGCTDIYSMIATCEPRQYPPQVVHLQVHAPKQHQAATASYRYFSRNRATSSSRRDLHPRFCFLYGVRKSPACVNKVRGRHRLVGNWENSNPPAPPPPTFQPAPLRRAVAREENSRLQQKRLYSFIVLT